MAYVRKRQSGWQAVWMLPSGERRSETRTGWVKRDALAYAVDQEQVATRTPWAASRTTEIPTVGDYAHATTLTREGIAESTRSKEHTLFKRVDHSFGDRPLNTVAPSDIRRFVESLTAEGLAPATVRDIYGLLRMTFDYAVADELVAQSPCVKVRLPKRATFTVEAADPGDVQALVEVIDVRYSAVIAFLIGTGCRIGEALAVKVSDLVDLPRPAVRISRTLSTGENGCTVVKAPKTSAGVRQVTLPRWVAARLRHHVIELGLGPDSWLFPAPEGGVMDPRRFRSRVWRPACREAGVSVSPHQLRHWQVSQLIAEGRPVTEIAARLGHASPGVTLDVYAHWMSGDDSGAAEVIPDLFGANRGQGHAVEEGFNG